MSVTESALAAKRAKTPAAGQARAGAKRSDESPAPRPASFATYVFAVGLVTLALTFYVFLRVSSLRLGYDLTHARQEQLRLVLENRELRTEIGTLSSPSRLQSLAREKLGMIPGERLVDLTGGNP